MPSCRVEVDVGLQRARTCLPNGTVNRFRCGRMRNVHACPVRPTQQVIRADRTRGALRRIKNWLLASSLCGPILGNQWIKYQTTIDAAVNGDIR